MSSPRSAEESKENEAQDELPEIIHGTEIVFFEESQFMRFECKEDKNRYAVEHITSDEYSSFKNSANRKDQLSFILTEYQFEIDGLDVCMGDSKRDSY